MKQPGPDKLSAMISSAALPGEHLHYRMAGTGPHTVLLLHGFAATMHTWDDLVPLFPPDRFTLHLIDLKGHGRSITSSGNDYSPQHNARLVAAYIRSRGLSNVTLIGHSFGGVVALLTAMDCPDITRLILIGTPGFPQKIPAFMRLVGLPFIGPLLLNAAPARMIARGGLERAFHRRERITGQMIERYAAGYRRKGIASALARTVRQILPPHAAQITARYATLSIPVLLLWGEYDRVVRHWQAEKLNRELRYSRLVILPDCGHNPHEERPQETCTLIMDFLSASGVDNI